MHSGVDCCIINESKNKGTPIETYNTEAEICRNYDRPPIDNARTALRIVIGHHLNQHVFGIAALVDAQLGSVCMALK